MNLNVLLAIFRRNFNSYFSNPTGYVFICVFVLLSSLAAFWPHEFFANNLASLDQLNRSLPLILLVFIPAITMSIWSEERRLGTDELLLTIPATDVDVVCGKYLAAVAIYTVSLLFSLTNVFVLSLLGEPDWGALAAGYVGYWLVGVAMLAIGMAASFLTSNVTVGFVLGVLFNAPLVFASSADVILWPEAAIAVKQWSLAERFRDFGRGVISLPGLVFFVSICGVMLYLCLVLIGRRHWLGGRDGRALLGHFVVRSIALVLLAVGVCWMVRDRLPARVDLSQGRVNSLHPKTLELLGRLPENRTVRIDAYVSPEMPESLVQHRLDLLSLLAEFKSRSGGRIQINVYDTEQFSDRADEAEKQYGIRPRRVPSMSRGAYETKPYFLGAAVTSGLEKVVIPFFNRGIPVEYELVRSILTVGGGQKKRLGLVGTDARLTGGGGEEGESADHLYIEELKKQYDVVNVDASNKIGDQFACLLVVQPSTLDPQQMDHLLEAIRGGVPTALFEDPAPFFDRSVPGTSFPRRAPGGMMSMMGGGQRQAPPKGDIEKLWDLLGVRFDAQNVLWQSFNPYKALPVDEDPQGFTREWLFIDTDTGDRNVFNEDHSISAHMKQLLLIHAGSVSKRETSNLEFTPLVRTTSERSGQTPVSNVIDDSMTFFRGAHGVQVDFITRRKLGMKDSHVVAAMIRGKSPAADLPMAGPEDAPKPAAPAGKEMKVVLVADSDVLVQGIFAATAAGNEDSASIKWEFQNVPFLLNVVDVLAGNEDFVEIRKRRPGYSTLKKFEERVSKAQDETLKTKIAFREEFDTKIKDEQAKLDETIKKIDELKDVSERQRRFEKDWALKVGNDRLTAQRRELTHERDRNIAQVENQLQGDIRRLQDQTKLWAVAVPPLLPLFLGSIVYVRRRSQETLGVSKQRMR